MEKRNLGILYCTIAVLSWGGMFPIMGTVLSKMNPFAFTAIRYTLAALLFAFFLSYKEGIKELFKIEKPWLLLLLGSMGFAGFGFLVFLGQKLAGPKGQLTASVFMALMPMLSVFVNWSFRKIKPTKVTLVFIGLSLFGALYSATKGHLSNLLELGESLQANIAIIIGAFCWVSYTIGAVNFPKWSPVKYTTLSTIFSLPTIFIVNIAVHGMGMVELPTLSIVQSIIPQIFYMVVFAAFIAVLAWNMGNKILTPINGVLFMDLVPVTAFLVSLAQGVKPGTPEIIGAACTVSALLLNNIWLRYQTVLTNRFTFKLSKA